MKKTIVALMIIGLFANLAFAHHAMEYVSLESYSTAKQGEKVFHVHYDYMVDENGNPALDHYEFTPGITYGITNRLMFDIHTHFAKFGKDHLIEAEQENFGEMGPSPFMEAFALAIQFRVTEDFPIDIAIAGVYEEPFKRSIDLLDGQRVFEGCLILSKDFAEHSNVCLNLKGGLDGEEKFTEWAFGVKIPISADSHGIAAGIEFHGDFEEVVENSSILPGVYFPLGSEDTVFKTGIEFGKDNIHVNATLMYRF